MTFEQLGVDRLYVDEAHNYKNLFLYTKMRLSLIHIWFSEVKARAYGGAGRMLSHYKGTV